MDILDGLGRIARAWNGWSREGIGEGGVQYGAHICAWSCVPDVSPFTEEKRTQRGLKVWEKERRQ